MFLILNKMKIVDIMNKGAWRLQSVCKKIDLIVLTFAVSTA